MDLLGRSIAAETNPLLAQAYEGDQSRRLAATGQIDSARQAGRSQQLAALSGQTDVEGRNIGNQLDAASRMAGIRQGDTQLGAGMLGQIANIQNAGIQNQLAAGQTIGGLRNQNVSNQLNALGGMTSAQQAGAGMNLQGANSLAGMNQGDFDRALGAAQGQTSLQNQNLNNQMNASNSQLGTYAGGLNTALSAGNAMPSYIDMLYSGADRMGQVGQFNQQRSQAQLAADINRFNQMNEMPWSQLGRYQNAVAGLGGLIPAAASVINGQSQSAPWTQAAGLGIGGLGALGSLGGAQGLAGLAGLLCDRDRKTDIELVGFDPTIGLNLYAFRYKSDVEAHGRGIPKVVSFMADEVAAKYPHAVRKINGVSVIDVNKIGH
jgi:hypothetical protein